MQDPIRSEEEEEVFACPVCGGPTYLDALYILGQVERVCSDSTCEWDGYVVESWGDDE